MNYDTIRTIHIDHFDDDNLNPIGGVIHVHEDVEIQSKEPFLNYHLDNAIFELTDIEKINLMGSIANITNNPYLFAEPLAQLYFEYKDDKAVCRAILEVLKMKEIIAYLEERKIDVKDDDDLEKAVRHVLKGYKIKK
ncbi:MAG: hypothetical protein J5895_02270 [Alphaproteobacteria bacterium]|nr:hypothetical protein [Alphaproteobacteria bacterium]